MDIRGSIGSTRSSSGYTIIEVMIFIAVSALIFIAAITAIGGRQQQVQFAQSVREFESKISDVINDVVTGYYPADSTIGCRITGGKVELSFGLSVPVDIGSNEECLYVGKALQFKPSGTALSGEGDGSKFLVYNLAGRRFAAGGITTAKTIDESSPAAVAFDNPFSVDTVEEVDLRFGVEVTKVFEEIGPASVEEYGVISVLSSFEGGNISSPVSSSQSVQIGGIRSTNTKLGSSKPDAINIINSMTEDTSEHEGYINTNSRGIVICLIDPDGRRASVTIGAGGNSSVFLQIDDYDRRCEGSSP